MLPDDKVAAVPDQDVGGEVMSYGDIHPYAEVFMDGWSPFVRNINIHNNTISLAAGLNNPQGALIEDLINGYSAFHSMQPDIASGKTTVPHILYDGVGELLANTANPGGGGSIMQAIAGGINQVAAEVKTNIPGVPDYTDIDLDKFAPYATDGGVCQTNNNIDGMNLFAASVYETTATDSTFDASGLPLSKLEQLAGGNLSIAASIMADPDGVMSCGSGFVGTPATVTFNTQTFGCTADDSENPSCAL